MGVGDDYEIGTDTKSDPFFCSTNLDPIVSTLVSFNGFSDSPYSSSVMENQEMSRICNDSFGTSYVDMAPSLLSYGNNCDQIAQPCIPNKENEVVEVAASHIRKGAKTETEPNPYMNQKTANASREIHDIVREQNMKKTEKDLKNGTNSLYTQLAQEDTYNKHVQSEGSPREGYVLLRARKGQATKGHSLAERLRREKISERMKLLQELVPGCNKITGKAVMLDEIINYVQSLQQQVQFLSMKLATVTPEINYDIQFQMIMSKDIFDSRNGAAPNVRFGCGTNPSSLYGFVQGTVPSIPPPNHQFMTFPQNVLDNELQRLYQPGFPYNSSFDG